MQLNTTPEETNVSDILSAIPEATKLDKFRYKVENIWNGICNWINPKNKWLTKAIPNHYQDKDSLIQIVLFKCLIDYVEGEKALEIIDWDGEESSKYKEIIEYCYEAITQTLPELNKICDDTPYPWTEEQWQLYSDTMDEISKTEQTVCEAIVKIRGVLWT